MIKLISISVSIIVAFHVTFVQSGGTYPIEKSVTAAGGLFSISETLGQPVVTAGRYLPIKVARQLAGHLIGTVLKTSPNRFKFENGEMRFN